MYDCLVAWFDLHGGEEDLGGIEAYQQKTQYSSWQGAKIPSTPSLHLILVSLQAEGLSEN